MNESENDPAYVHQSDLIMAALTAGLNEDGDAVNDALNTLGNEYGWKGLLAAVLGWTNLVQDAYGIANGGGEKDGFFVLSGVDMETGEHVSVEETGNDPALIAAARIFATWGNGDRPMAAAILMQAAEDGFGHDVVAAMLAFTLDALRSLESHLSSSQN